MRFVYKERYLKRFDRFSRQDQLLIAHAARQIRAYYATRQAPHGLRIKLLHTHQTARVFEARASQSIRILWAEQGDTVTFALVGLHDEVTRYLRSLR